MYDSKQFQSYSKITVGQLIDILKALPQNARLAICGDEYCYIHIETDGTVVNLDNNSLDDCYYEDINIET